MRFTIICLSLVLLGSPLPGQDRVVAGEVRMAADSTPLADARILARDAPGFAQSGPSGAFRLRLPAGSVRLVAARIGFAPESLLVTPAANRPVFYLRSAPVSIEPLTVATERALSAASSSIIRDLDIQLRPRETSQELLRLVPGLVIAQHAGGGKAEQIFLRGFDADHGTDVAVSVDGRPVNMVSHAHGQGYADLHFLLPEIVEYAEVRKGPYDARDGDLATAGAVSFRTRDRVDGSVATRGGSFGTGHGLALIPLGGDASRAGGYVALAGHYSDGPFDRPQGYRRINAFAKGTAPIGSRAQLVATASGFDSRWDASGQIPQRALDRGLLGRFGAIDPAEGGTTSRYDLSLGLRSDGGESDWEARAYVLRYDLRLFSNFTFFARDSINGDGIEQVDDRITAGGDAGWRGAGPLGGTSAFGGGIRSDLAEVALHYQKSRLRLGTVAHDRVRQHNLFTWVKQEIALGSRARLELGIRADLFRFQVENRLSNPDRSNLNRTRGIVSPKANLAVNLGAGMTAYANTGFGFHSNDARDVVIAKPGDQILPRAFGSELGARRSWPGGSVALALWNLDLESELVFVGDEGVTEASGRTRRSGVDLEGRFRILPWLWADLDVTLSRGRFRDGPPDANRIPLAPTLTMSGGLTLRDLGPVAGGLRVRHVGSRAADEAGEVTARGYTLMEVFSRWQVARFVLKVAVDNLWNVQWNEAQFATTSRLAGETVPVTELHFTPGAPRSVQVGIEYGW
jgi:TonB-dependent Receptor Plug Domain